MFGRANAEGLKDMSLQSGGRCFKLSAIEQFSMSGDCQIATMPFRSN